MESLDKSFFCSVLEAVEDEVAEEVQGSACGGAALEPDCQEKENKNGSEMCTALQLTAYKIQPSVCTIGAVRDWIEAAK